MERNWKKIEGFDFKEILFEEFNHIAKITINRERYRNAFTPLTTWEMSQAFSYCRECADIRVVLLTGAGDKAFCAGGDMNVKGRGGYVGSDGVPRLNVLDVQMQIRRLPKPVIAMVNGDDATCKRLVKYASSIALVSLNTKYEPMMFTNEEIMSKPVRVIGKVIELRGKF